MTWTFPTEQIAISGSGEAIYTAGDRINTYFDQLSSAWFAFNYQYTDARAQQVLNVPFSKLDRTVVDYLTGAYYFDTAAENNLVMDKLYQLPLDKQQLMYHTYWNPELYPQRPGVNDVVRCLYYNGAAGVYSFANNKVMADSYSDFVGVIGNVYYDRQTVDIVTNGVIYNYSKLEFEPGHVYYLTDLMDGWMIPYEEGGDGQLVSIPIAVAVHKNSAIMLTERAMTKDLPCLSACPPTRLRFEAEQPDYTRVIEPDCDNVKLLIASNETTTNTPITDTGNVGLRVKMNGGVTHSTVEKKFGNSSIYFNGLESTYLNVKNNSEFNLSKDKFTIEFWVWFGDIERHDFIMGLWDNTLRKRGWMIEAPSDNYGYGNGIVFTVNDGFDTDDHVIRIGCDYAFLNKNWYHVAIARNGPATDPHTADHWHIMIDGVKQNHRLTAGAYDNTIPDFDGGRLVIGAPTVDTHISNKQTLSATDMSLDGDVDNIVSSLPTDKLKIELDAGVVAGDFVVTLKEPVQADQTIQQIETSNVGDVVELSLMDTFNNWEKIVTHTTTTGFNIISEILPVAWRTKHIKSIKWRYQPTGNGGNEHLTLSDVRFRRNNNELDWLLLSTSRTPFTEPLRGYMEDIRVTIGETAYTGSFELSGNPHPACFVGCDYELLSDVPDNVCRVPAVTGDVVALYDCEHPEPANVAPPEEQGRPLMLMQDAHTVDYIHVNTTYGTWPGHLSTTLSATDHECFEDSLVSTVINQGAITYRMNKPTLVYGLRVPGWRDNFGSSSWTDLGTYDRNNSLRVYSKFFSPGDHEINNDSATLIFKPYDYCETPVAKNSITPEVLLESDQSNSAFVTPSVFPEDTTNRIYGFDVGDPASYIQTDHKLVDLEGGSPDVLLSTQDTYYIENGGYIHHRHVADCDSIDLDVLPQRAWDAVDTVTVEMWAVWSYPQTMLFGWYMYDYINFTTGSVPDNYGFNLGWGRLHCGDNAQMDKNVHSCWKHYVMVFNRDPDQSSNKIYVNGQNMTLNIHLNYGIDHGGRTRAHFNDGSCRLFGWRSSGASSTGMVAKFNMYDGEMDPTQVDNNFNALKHRFAIV